MAYPPSTLATDKADSTTAATDHPGHHNALGAAVNDIVAELGTSPSGAETDLTARLTALDTTVAGKAAASHSHNWTLLFKPADESKNNLASVANDTDLTVTLTANTNYHLRVRAYFLTNATADLKYRLVFGGTTTRVRRRVQRTATTDAAVTTELKTAFDSADVVLSTTGLNPWLEEDVILQVGASGGVFALQWSQGTSNAGPTTCLEGSYIEYAVT